MKKKQIKPSRTKYKFSHSDPMFRKLILTTTSNYNLNVGLYLSSPETLTVKIGDRVGKFVTGEYSPSLGKHDELKWVDSA